MTDAQFLNALTAIVCVVGVLFGLVTLYCACGIASRTRPPRPPEKEE